MNYIEITTKLWLLIGVGFGLSVLINILFIFKELARRFPHLFYEEEK